MIFRTNSCGCQQIMDWFRILTSSLNLTMTFYKILNWVSFITHLPRLHNKPLTLVALICLHNLKILKISPLIKKLTNRNKWSIILLVRMTHKILKFLVRIIKIKELKKMNSGNIYLDHLGTFTRGNSLKNKMELINKNGGKIN